MGRRNRCTDDFTDGLDDSMAIAEECAFAAGSARRGMGCFIDVAGHGPADAEQQACRGRSPTICCITPDGRRFLTPKPMSSGMAATQASSPPPYPPFLRNRARPLD
jgi:hypothetical protein